jgi:hypothetical protein
VRPRGDEKERESFEEVRQEEDDEGVKEGRKAEARSRRVVRDTDRGDPSWALVGPLTIPPRADILLLLLLTARRATSRQIAKPRTSCAPMAGSTKRRAASKSCSRSKDTLQLAYSRAHLRSSNNEAFDRLRGRACCC